MKIIIPFVKTSAHYFPYVIILKVDATVKLLLKFVKESNGVFQVVAQEVHKYW